MKSGFSLIEMTIVILILGILAAVAAPRIYDIRNDAEATSILSNVNAVHTAARLFKLKKRATS